ncbi:DUF4231 domain-containing protein [Lentzea flava]|uniref:SMODS and SLOG-associating 2TM effector domain-containing protein n=1 Tax=Lentzea flava TaxID=103732 RepID=A0ABQ2VFY2_9PSEU|nr:DUF4231 domain-containing protein [Lentzea flava]MCP2204625.1 Protein of unknown function (DUF4231) [Lentzea flava]GGU79736.1 hypothetical protein GCM10010178_83260 [Lentzea flava]
MIDQVVFAFTGTSGMGPVASSLDRGATLDWHEKLRQHTRLFGAAPAISFSHLEFPDGTAAVLRRAGKAGDAGRNLAHALVGSKEIIALVVPSMTRWEDGWLDTAPPSDQLPALSAALFGAPAESDVDDALVAPIASLARSRPSGTFSVIGVPDEQRLAVVWRLRELLPATTWTFSTYEKTDADKPNLPRLIFLSERPHDSVEPQPGRLRVDVTAETSHHLEEPITEEIPVQVAVAPVPVQRDLPNNAPVPIQRDLPGVLYGNGPVHQRLLQLAEIVESQDIESVHRQAPAWLPDLAVPPSLAAYAVEYLENKGFKDLDPPLARRWRAEQGVAHTSAAALEPEPARPPTDHALVDQVWQRHAHWSAAADAAKRKAVHYRRFTLIALIAGAVGAVLSAQLTTVAEWATGLTAGLTAAIVSAGTYVRQWREPAARQAWTSARHRSETLKSAACAYLAGAGTAEALRERMAEIGPHTVTRSPKRPPDITDAATFSASRVDGQIRYHEVAADRYERKLRLAEQAELAFGLISVVLSAVAALYGGVVVWAGVCTTIAGAITAHVSQSGYQLMIASYRRTASDLHRLQRSLPSRKDLAAQARFVVECERVLELQNADWHTQHASAQGKDQR